MASRIILDPETLLAQAGEMQSLTAEYESLFSKVTGTLNDTNNNWSELLAHNFAGKISSAQQSFASITELLASGAAAAGCGWRCGTDGSSHPDLYRSRPWQLPGR
jgi:uncharacterized protein YukE